MHGQCAPTDKSSHSASFSIRQRSPKSAVFTCFLFLMVLPFRKINNERQKELQTAKHFLISIFMMKDKDFKNWVRTKVRNTPSHPGPARCLPRES